MSVVVQFAGEAPTSASNKLTPLSGGGVPADMTSSHTSSGLRYRLMSYRSVLFMWDSAEPKGSVSDIQGFHVTAGAQ